MYIRYKLNVDHN